MPTDLDRLRDLLGEYMPPKRILVTGSRDWFDEMTLTEALSLVALVTPYGTATLVHGACPTGADRMAAEWVRTQLDWTEEPHPAAWRRYGRSAGHRRNAEMVNAGADLCLAFILPCSSAACRRPKRHGSHGAAGCADLAEKAGIPTWRCER